MIPFRATLEVLGSEVLGRKYGNLHIRAPSSSNTCTHEGHEQVPEAQTFMQDPNHAPFPKHPGDPEHRHMQAATPCFLCLLHLHSSLCLRLLAKLTASLSKRWSFTQRTVGEVSSLSLDVLPLEALPASLISYIPDPLTCDSGIWEQYRPGTRQRCGPGLWEDFPALKWLAAGVRGPFISERFPRMMIVQPGPGDGDMNK